MLSLKISGGLHIILSTLKDLRKKKLEELEISNIEYHSKFIHHDNLDWEEMVKILLLKKSKELDSISYLSYDTPKFLILLDNCMQFFSHCVNLKRIRARFASNLAGLYLRDQSLLS